MAIAFAVNVVPFTSAVLFSRIHANRISGGSGATLTISCTPTAPSETDPQDFTESTTPDASLQILDSSTDPAPKYKKSTASTINGPFWKVELKAVQDPSSPVTLAVQVSLGLVLRST